MLMELVQKLQTVRLKKLVLKLRTVRLMEPVLKPQTFHQMELGYFQRIPQMVLELMTKCIRENVEYRRFVGVRWRDFND
jgi:hypothetical protein